MNKNANLLDCKLTNKLKQGHIMNKNFNEVIQLSESIQIPKLGLINLKDFFRAKVNDLAFWNYTLLTQIISLIPEQYAVNENECELFLPVNKDEMRIEEALSYISENIIDLRTDVGKKEAGRRLSILAYLLSLPGGVIEGGKVLHPGGCDTYIGYFSLPSDEIYGLSVDYKSDGGENGAWWFRRVDNQYRHLKGFWFAFSPELQTKVNSSWYIKQ